MQFQRRGEGGSSEHLLVSLAETEEKKKKRRIRLRRTLTPSLRTKWRKWRVSV